MTYRMSVSMFLVLCLACLTACASRSMPSDPAHVAPTHPSASIAVYVSLMDNKIESSLVTFYVGHPYHFAVTNRGKTPRDFLIKTEVQGPNPHGPYNQLLHISSAIPPGASRSFTYIFSIIAPQSAVEFVTRLPGSGSPGPQLPVQVEQG